MTEETWEKEYPVVTARLNALDGWAQQFVTLYLAFNIGAATALAVSYKTLSDLNSASISVLGMVLRRGDTIIFLFCSLGMFLGLWAGFMLHHYFSRMRVCIDRAAELERRLYPSDHQGCYATRSRTLSHELPSVVLGVLTPAVVAFFFLAWLAVILI